MKKSYIILAIVVVILLIIIINWRVLFPKKPRNASKAAAAAGAIPNFSPVYNKPIGQGVGLTADNLVSLLPLHRPMKGPEVLELQRVINLASGANIAEDGIFGPQTEQELIDLTGTSSITLERAWSLWVKDYVSPDNKLKTNLAWLGFKY